MEGGERWDQFWSKVAGDLLRRQRLDGSWYNDVGPGDHFSTAMACLILRVPLGLLPVFRH